jgi:hypothetical protein
MQVRTAATKTDWDSMKKKSAMVHARKGVDEDRSPCTVSLVACHKMT